MTGLVCEAGVCVVEVTLYETSEITATMTAAAGADSTKIEVEFTLSALGYLELTAYDKLEAIQGTEVKQMNPDGRKKVAGRTWYEVTLNTTAPGTEFRVELLRDHHDDRQVSAVKLPGMFILAPLSKDIFSRGEDIILIWTPAIAAGDTTVLNLSGDCLQPIAQIPLFAGQTSYKIPAGKLKKRDPAPAVGDAGVEEVPDSCPVTLTISRSSKGKIDPAFKGGSFTASVAPQMRSITSVP